MYILIALIKDSIFNQWGSSLAQLQGKNWSCSRFFKFYTIGRLWYNDSISKKDFTQTILKLYDISTDEFLLYKITTHFSQMLQLYDRKIPKNSILVTFDVKSLYTKIPHDDDIKCCLIALTSFYDNNLPIPIPQIKQLLSFQNISTFGTIHLLHNGLGGRQGS